MTHGLKKQKIKIKKLVKIKSGSHTNSVKLVVMGEGLNQDKLYIPQYIVNKLSIIFGIHLYFKQMQQTFLPKLTFAMISTCTHKPETQFHGKVSNFKSKKTYPSLETPSSNQKSLAIARILIVTEQKLSTPSPSTLMLTSGTSGCINALFLLRVMKSLFLIHAFVLMLLMPFRGRKQAVLVSPTPVEKSKDEKSESNGGSHRKWSRW